MNKPRRYFPGPERVTILKLSCFSRNGTNGLLE